MITPDGKTAYVVNTKDGTVTPIRTATNTAGPPIPVGNEPIRLAVTPDGTTVYVLNFDDATVTPIRTASNCRSADPGRPAAQRDRGHSGQSNCLRRQHR